MPPIIIRGLKRSFAIEAGPALSPLQALRTRPDLPGAEPMPEPIAVMPAGNHYRVRFPSGLMLEGSLRECAFQIDERILRQARAAESGALILPAAIVRGPAERRIALVGSKGASKSWISLCLLARGWRIEGDAWAVVRLNGVRALPRTIRIEEKPAPLPDALRRFAENAPLLPAGPSTNMHVVDPRNFGSPWQLQAGPLSALVFLERNPGGHGAISALGRDSAFRRALALCADHINGPGAAGLRLAIAGAPAYRLQVGCPERAAERLVEAFMSSQPCASN